MNHPVTILRRLARATLLAAGLVATGAAGAGAAGAGAAAAGASEPLQAADYQRVNEALVTGHVMPRYQALAGAMAAFDEAATAYCGAPGAGTLASLRTAYGAALDGWMGVQHLHFGPVELFMRSYRLYFWPQGRGKIGEAVGALLAEADPAALEEERFRNASTAIQGLPAAEVLLFGSGSEEPPSAYRCALLRRLAGNMREMAAQIVEEWRGGEVDFAGTVAEPGPHNPYFETPREAALAFFQALYNGLEMTADARLKPVLGAAPESARPQLAETPLAGRSLRNIVLSLEALQSLYWGEGGPGLGALAAESGLDPELDPLLRRAFGLTLDTARAAEGPLAEAVLDPARRPVLEKLQTQLTALKQIVRGRFSVAAGLAVGFNAMDGD